jgi:hypothetical protein
MAKSDKDTETKKELPQPQVVLVNNKSKRVVVVQGTRLVPGVNVVPVTAWDLCKKDLGDRVGSDKDFSEVTESVKDADGRPTGEKQAADFSSLAPEKAAKVVEQTNDAELLNSWLVTESRESVRKAIYARLEELKK